ncbi:MAG: RAMP superfamily CRISPR-associated protein [Planctomycetaceae bacterium]|jgi:CRISPR-associated protein (TIGR03986 family)|nr:RAMP superfamily CRISPR-associated protein [Planctomycetaceae bacterium]
MSQIKGKLQVKEDKGKKAVMLMLPTKKGGDSPHQIPTNAKFFRDNDATDGLEVDVEKDTKNNIIKVSIPGKESVLQNSGKQVKQNNYRENNRGYNNSRLNDTNKLSQENPQLIGFPFHNPYTFIPFTKNGKRNKPTLQTADETEKDRFTGIIEIKVTTQSPLLTYQPEKNKKEEHAEHKALTIGNDVIVPATSVRGALRYLLTVVTGGPLTVVDEEMFLCQGRDLPMDIDPANCRNPNAKPCCLARVVNPGNSKHDGTIQLGETVIVPAADIKNKYQGNFDDKRPKDKQDVHYLWVNYHSGKIVSVSEKQDATHNWQVKLCGKPVNTKGVKREGIFLANGKEMELPVKYWLAYANRNRHGAHPELKKGDLIWLELKDSANSVPHIQDNIVSVQWARWGRQGTELTKILDDEVLPDYQKNDGNVATVTDMFGIVPVSNKNSNIPAFAGRIRPDNLVFLDGKEHLTPMFPLAVLASPHPGCLPFYRNGNAQTLNQLSPLAGYKVYRTSKHTGIDDKDASWKFENQGVYDDKGNIKDGTKEKVNFSAELLKPNVEGTLRLSVRSLSMKELALLVLVCNDNTWRLGGGKPLGLGQCNVQIIEILDEHGNKYDWKNDTRLNVLDTDVLKNWKKTQEPVELLRYPRSAIRNKNKIIRGGLTWFSNLGTPKKNGENGYRGMQTVRFGDRDIQGQVLPTFKTDAADFLYGYDVFLEEVDKDGNKKVYHFPPEQFDPEKHSQGNEQSGGFQGQNRQIRTQWKEKR